MALRMTRRSFLAVAAGGLAALALPGCTTWSDETVVIYSCAEGVRNETLLKAMHEQFPHYDIRLHYVPTGNCAAKLKLEGERSEADIVLDFEGGYLSQVSESFEDISFLDTSPSRYCADLVDASGHSFPFARESACVAVNEEQLKNRGLPMPTSYDDLLDPMFKGHVCMPNPKSSGTGYNFLKSLVNARGEEAAFSYFDALSENIYQFTSSGSGPVNALVQGEAAVGFGMTFQAVSEINQGVPLKALFFEEGAPWAVYGMGVVKGNLSKNAVKDVFSWLSTEGVRIDNETYVPDQVLVDYKAIIKNYPVDIVYADMAGITDANEKLRLLKEWKH